MTESTDTVAGTFLGGVRSRLATNPRQLVGRLGAGGLATIIALAPVAILLIVLVLARDGSPSEVLRALAEGSAGSADAWSRTITHAAPLLVVAVGAIVAMRGGLLNIGQEGQVMLGGLAAAAVGIKLGGPNWLTVTLALLAACLAGGVWAGIAAVLRSWRRIDEVISTLLLTFVAAQVVSYALNRSWLLAETGEIGISIARTDQPPAGFDLPVLPEIFGLSLELDTVIALGMTALVVVLLGRTAWGFRVRMLGHSPVVARRAGVRPGMTGGQALAVSGAIAGLAGALVLLSTRGRYTATTTFDIGWEGILVALAAREKPVLAILTALLFGALHTGGGFLLSTGVPSSLTSVAEGAFVIAAIVAPLVARSLRARSLSGSPSPGVEA